ncbi:MAG: hypothetical protein IPL73_07010 [Candidatus Obscuribacter sp.]|nr:hypothetical protein [Candidatus Obscuribacter sp.]
MINAWLCATARSRAKIGDIHLYSSVYATIREEKQCGVEAAEMLGTFILDKASETTITKPVLAK